MNHVGHLVVREDTDDVLLLVVKLEQHLTRIAGPDTHCSLSTSSENVVSIGVHSRDAALMGISNFPDLSLALFHYKSAEEAIAPPRHNRLSVIVRKSDRDSLRSFIGIRRVEALIITEVP